MLYALQIYFDSKPSFHRTGSKWAMLELPFQKRAINGTPPTARGKWDGILQRKLKFWILRAVRTYYACGLLTGPLKFFLQNPVFIVKWNVERFSSLHFESLSLFILWSPSVEVTVCFINQHKSLINSLYIVTIFALCFPDLGRILQEAYSWSLFFQSDTKNIINKKRKKTSICLCPPIVVTDNNKNNRY